MRLHRWGFLSGYIESEKHYRLLFEQANDIIFIVDLNGNLKEANPLASDLLGYSRNELLTMWTTACLVDTILGNPLLILYSKIDWACKA